MGPTGTWIYTFTLVDTQPDACIVIGEVVTALW